MASHVTRLPRPYDYRVLIETFIYTRRGAFVHNDFEVYYAGLLSALERLFGIRLIRDELSFSKKILWSLFENTVSSLNRVSTPWDSYLEEGLLHRKLEESGEYGGIVYRASDTIADAAKVSEAAHREMLYALFLSIFGECERIVTSEELRQAGFDDSREPDIVDYYDYM